MRHSSSTSTTLNDLENAMKFLNKELTVEDIENIYGDFNDPTFQSALKEAKQMVDGLIMAYRLRDLNTIKAVIEKNIRIINKAVIGGLEVARNLRSKYLGASMLENLYYTEKFTQGEGRRRKTKTFTIESNSLVKPNSQSDVGKLVLKYQQQMESKLNKNPYYVSTFYEKEYQGQLKAVQYWSERGREEAQKIVTIDKRIYGINLQTLVNVIQDMFTMVLNNLYY